MRSNVPARVAVVLEVEPGRVGEAGRGDAPPGVFELRRRQGDAAQPGAVLAGGDLREAAPAAADLEHLVAFPQPGRLDDAAILVALRRLEVVGAGLVIGARIGHAGVEPARVERVRQVVMRLDVAPRAGLRVVAHEVPDAIRQALAEGAAAERGEALLVAQEEAQEVREVVDLDVAVDIGLREADRAAAHAGEERLQRAEGDGDLEVLLALEAEPPPVRHLDVEPADRREVAQKPGAAGDHQVRGEAAADARPARGHPIDLAHAGHAASRTPGRAGASSPRGRGRSRRPLRHSFSASQWMPAVTP